MVPCPWFAEAAAMARDRPEHRPGRPPHADGSEWPNYRWGPVSGASQRPEPGRRGLEDSRAPPPRRVAKADPAEAEVELRAQIDRALEAGIDVTHLDAHMGAAMMPPLARGLRRPRARVPAADLRDPARPDAARRARSGRRRRRVLPRARSLRVGRRPDPRRHGRELAALRTGSRAKSPQREAPRGPRSVASSYLICHPAPRRRRARRHRAGGPLPRLRARASTAAKRGRAALAAEGLATRRHAPAARPDARRVITLVADAPALHVDVARRRARPWCSPTASAAARATGVRSSAPRRHASR